MSGLRSDLGKAKGISAGGKGSKHWLLQRISAVAMLPLLLFVFFNLGEISQLNYIEAKIWFKHPLNAIMMSLLIFNICFHGALGLQVVIEDYVSCKVAKFSGLILMKIAFFAIGFAGIFSIFSLYS